MKREDYRFNLSETPIIADQVLRNYKRDRSFFEYYSPIFDNKFLISFEEKVNAFVHLSQLQLLKSKISKTEEKTQTILARFNPLLRNIDAFLRIVPKATRLPVAKLGLTELRDALNRKCLWEIQRSCRKMISEFEFHLEKFIDRGFLSIILNDLHVLVEKLKYVESEMSDLTNHRDMIVYQYLTINNQLEDIVGTIIDSTSAVFGENNTDKREEYSIEKLITQAQYRRGENQ